MRNSCFLLILFACLSLPGQTAGEEVSSGLAPGGRVQPLNVRDCTGPAAGKTLCYTCRYGSRPVVGVFTREITTELTQLVAALNDQVRRERQRRMAVYVVVIGNDTTAAEERLKEISREHELRHIPLTILRDSPQKLATGYGISPEAMLTVLMWRDGRVEAGRGFTSAQLDEKEITRVLSDTESILDEPE